MARGHRESDIVNSYSLTKIFEYYEAGMRNVSDEIKRESCALRAAYHADEKQFKSFLKSLGS